MNSSSKVSFECTIGSTTIKADAHFYELIRLPRGRICRLVEQRGGSQAAASPLTNLQRAMMTAKQLEWIPEETTLESCAIEVIACH
jgi:hypothetical protein